MSSADFGWSSRLYQIRVRSGKVLLLPAAVPCRIVPFRGIQGSEPGDFRTSFVFAAASDGGSACSQIQSAPGRRRSFSRRVGCPFEFLAGLFRQDNARNIEAWPPSRRKPAEPLVVGRTLRIESHRFFGTGDGGIVLLRFVVGLHKEELDSASRGFCAAAC